MRAVFVRLAADRRHDLVFDVGKLSLGYVVDFLAWGHARAGAGVYGGALFVPRSGVRLRASGVFLRLKIAGKANEFR